MFIIFDFDGVIVDSERSIFLYFQKVLKEKNIIVSDLVFSKKVGNTSEDFLREVTDLSDGEILKLSEQRRRDFFNDFSNYKLIDGVLDQIKRLAENNTLGICSNSHSKYIVPVLKHYDIEKYFQFVLGVESVTSYKPNPEIYNLGKQKMFELGEKSGFVIEDSVTGVLAAKLAGIKVVAITTSFLRKELKMADFVIDSFSELENII